MVVGGSIHVGWGGGYYNPAPAVRYYEPAPVYQPAYQPAPVYQPAIAARPMLPRWGIGVFGGAVAVEGKEAGSDLGLVGRLRLMPNLLLDGEIAKSEVGPSGNVSRIDRRLAVGLTYEISPYQPLSALVLGGVGVNQSDVGDSFQTTQEFGEIGLGLRYALTPRLHLQADIRAGSRAAADDVAPQAARAVAPSTEQAEQYTAGRIGATLFF